MTSPPRLIGVLGGMGPAATVDFLAKVVARTPAERDQDHVPLIVYDVPQIPPRAAAIRAGSDAPLAPMLAGIQMLNKAGVEAITIPCNTAHHWYAQLQAATGAPIIHIADAVLEALREKPVRRIGLAATRGTIMARIYHERLEPAGCEVIVPEEPTQTCVDQAIDAVKASDFVSAKTAAEQLVERLRNAGAERVLLACTELPVALAGSVALPHCLDATDALACATVAFSQGSKLPNSGARRDPSPAGFQQSLSS